MKADSNNFRLYIALILIFVIFLKYCYVLLSNYLGNALFVGPDAFGIFNVSILYGKGEILTTFDNPLTFFFFLLGKLYFYTFENYIWASTISIFVWIISYLFLYNVMKLLKFSYTNILFATLIYSFTPSIFTITSTTLREVWQLLIVNIFLFIFVKYYLNQKNFILTIIYLLILTIILFILHRGLILFGLFSIFLISLIFYVNLKIKTLYLPLLIPFLLLFFYIFLQYFNIFYIQNGWAQLKKGLPLAIEQYQRGVILSAPSARGNYIESVSIKNYFDLFLFLPVSFFQYLFEPIFSIMKINSLKDIIAIGENLTRILLIGLFLYKIKFNKNIFLYIFLLYLALEFIWSIGTVNWGTALRHHVPSIGLLIICSLHDKYYNELNKLQ